MWGRRVLLTLLPLPPTLGSVKTYRMRWQRGSYVATAGVTAPAAWQVLVRVAGSTPASDGRVVHFRLWVTPNSRVVQSTLTPLVGPARPAASESEVSVPLGGYVATLHVPGASLTRPIRMRVQLVPRERSTTLPRTVHLALNMEEMNMGVTRLTARAVRPGLYVTQASLPMGGTWRLTLTVGKLSASADLRVTI